MNWKCVWVALLLGVTVAWCQNAAGRIAGQVRDERLRPIAGARVSVQRVPEGKGDRKPFQAGALTASDGTFEIAVPEGTIEVCAALPGSQLLPSCGIAEAPARTGVNSGRRLELPAITLRRGEVLSVTIDDNRGILKQSKAQHSGALVLVGVGTPYGMSRPMPGRETPSGRTYQMLVPRDTPLVLSIRGRGVKMTDAAGTAVDLGKGQFKAFRFDGERSQKQFMFHLTGAAGNDGGK